MVGDAKQPPMFALRSGLAEAFAGLFEKRHKASRGNSG
jgi:hypothetical protein